MDVFRDRSFRRRAGVLAAVIFAVSFPLSIDAEDAARTVTLAQLIEEAMKNGPDIRKENASMALSRAAYDLAQAQNGFSLDGSAGASRTQPVLDTAPLPLGDPADSIQADLSFSGPSTKVDLSAGYTLMESPTLGHSTKLSLTASQTIWDGYLGGRGQAAVQQAGLTLQSNSIAHEANLKNIVYTLKQSFYAMLAEQRQLAILQDTLQKRNSELVRVQTMFDNHDATKIDLNQAKLNAAQAELDLRSARDDFSIAREKLSALVGWPADAPYSLEEAEELQIPDLGVEQAVKTALDRRADLAQLRLSRAKGDIALALQKADSQPSVSASGGITWNRNWTADTDQASWNAGLQVKLPIFDSGGIDAQVRQAQLQNDTSDIQIAQKIAAISTDVKNALNGLTELWTKADLSKKNLDLASDKYDLAKAKFDANSISMLDLLAASVDLAAAQVNLSKVKSDVQLGVLALQNAMGN